MPDLKKRFCLRLGGLLVVLGAWGAMPAGFAQGDESAAAPSTSPAVAADNAPPAKTSSAKRGKKNTKPAAAKPVEAAAEAKSSAANMKQTAPQTDAAKPTGETRKSAEPEKKPTAAKKSTTARKKKTAAKNNAANAVAMAKSTDAAAMKSAMPGTPSTESASKPSPSRQPSKEEQAKAADEKRLTEARRPAEFTPYPRPEAVPDHVALGKQIDGLLAKDLQAAGVELAPIAADEDFLRRVSFDLAGIAPTPEEVTLFTLDPDSDKRQLVIDRLLNSEAYAVNWSRYWRDVIYSRAVEQRAQISREAFEEWMVGQLRDNASWADITTKLLTAKGDVRKQGETALIYAQRGEPDEIASETARIFLGIQLQCANCHDHPTDKWKREEFHALAAFFPRLRVERVKGDDRSFELVSFTGPAVNPVEVVERVRNNADEMLARLDANKDGKLAKKELKGALAAPLSKLFSEADTDKDGSLTVEEIRKVPLPMMRGTKGMAEYYMPDLQNPQSAGTRFDPGFFLNGTSPGSGLGDVERRQALARSITSPENPWFARAFVNRMWAQLMGEGFVMPVDDMGPERTPRFPEVLDALAAGFTASGYDVKWLMRTIANTEAYQRRIRPRPVAENPPAFASACPTRLRADQVYDAITRILGVEELGGPAGRTQRKMAGRYSDSSARGQFRKLFGFDPSASPDEQQGNLPQALFLMNSTTIHNLIAGKGATRLATILSKHSSNDDALRELYLLVHAREPSARELEICGNYLKDVGNRQDAFEDILWSLINSTEFQTRR
ncbi:MAG TPA: hypothetical protein DDY91_16880 [Planctomycetaceae bacterium]|nr:hypothetical protein [Planctomycetaceae bacterium]